MYTRIIFSSLNIYTSVSSVALDERRKIYSWLHLFFKYSNELSIL